MLQWKASECRLYSWCQSQSCEKGHQEMPDKASMKKVWEIYPPKPALQLNHPISSFEPSIVTWKAPTARWSSVVAGAVPGPPFSRTMHASTLLSMVGQTFPMPVCKHLSASHKVGRIGSWHMRLPKETCYLFFPLFMMISSFPKLVQLNGSTQKKTRTSYCPIFYVKQKP